MKNFRIVALVLALVLSSASDATALPTSSLASVKARQDSTGRLVVTVVNSFDRVPASGETCKVSVHGAVSSVGEANVSSRKKYVTRAGVTKRVSKFRAVIPAPIGLTEGDQTQLNVQTTSVCTSRNGKRTVSIRSSSDATNVTCAEGITRGDFVKLISTKLFFLSESNSNSSQNFAFARGASSCGGN